MYTSYAGFASLELVEVHNARFHSNDPLEIRIQKMNRDKEFSFYSVYATFLLGTMIAASKATMGWYEEIGI